MPNPLRPALRGNSPKIRTGFFEIPTPSLGFWGRLDGGIKTGAFRLPHGLHRSTFRLCSLLAGLLGGGLRGRSLAGLQRGEFLHQAALTTGSIVLVNDTLFCGFIQGADGFHNGFFRFRRVGRDIGACLIDGSTGIHRGRCDCASDASRSDCFV